MCFFSVGTLNDRTLVIYMQKKGVSARSTVNCSLTDFHRVQLDSVFRVIEPFADRIDGQSNVPQTLGTRLGLPSKWFRVDKVGLGGARFGKHELRHLP